ncbi:MAG TPA: rhomboid family intramembrane serine protease [Acidimicrobiales bacterium]|nr:rhomboid family intramembrane serine protease [Acidimicrobiales bacterium]
MIAKRDTEPDDAGRSGDDGADDAAGIPKLTIGQRLLTALPNLQRQASPPPSNGRAKGDAADDVVTPDEVIDAADDEVDGASTSEQRRTSAGSTARGVSSSGSGTTRTGSGTTRSGSGGARTGGTGRPNPYADWTVEQLQRGMKYLDDNERRLAFLVGPLVAILDIVLTVLALHNHQPHYIHGKVNRLWVNPTETASLGIASAVIAGLVVVCAWFRRRSLTLFALLFSGYGGGLLTMLPAWVLAGWYFVHFNRMQKTLRQLTGPRPSTRTSARPTNPRQAARAGASSARARSEARRQRGKQPVPAGPSGSKRYTPPKPTRPRPPAPS